MMTRFFAICSLLFVTCLSCSMPESGLPNRQPYDPDLRFWKTASWSPFAVSDTISGFTYGATDGVANSAADSGRYIAVSYSGIIAYSDNGDIWYKANITPDSELSTPPSGFNSVCFGNGVFFAVGNEGKFAWSDDGGENWTSSQMTGFDPVHTIRGAVFGKALSGAEYFVAVGDDARISVSVNGRTWTGGPNTAFYDIQLNDVAFSMSNNRFYVVGNYGNRGYADNPMGAWTLRTPVPPINTSHITKVTSGMYGDGVGIGIVFNGKAAIATHVNFQDFDADVKDFLFEESEINGITWGGGFYTAAGKGAMIGWWPSGEPSREDDRFWRALPFDEFKLWEITALEACNGRFFVGNIGGKIGYSK